MLDKDLLGEEMSLFPFFPFEELLVRVKSITIQQQAINDQITEICQKLSSYAESPYDWENAQKKAERMQVNFPKITGNLESDARLAFVVVLQDKPKWQGVKFAGIRAGKEYKEAMKTKLLPITKETWAAIPIGDPVVYEFHKEGEEDDPAVLFTHKKYEWIDTPEFSGMTLQPDPEAPDKALTLMKAK